MGLNSNLTKSKYHISKMDCSAEEQMIRMKLEAIDRILHLEFDIPSRSLIVLHKGNNELITKYLAELNLGSKLLESRAVSEQVMAKSDQAMQSKLLWAVLIINFGFFLIEMTFGLISKSMGLISDSLDMFADATVYGMSLLVIGKALSKKKLVAKLAGLFQLALAVGGFVEVVRRFISVEAMPDYKTMIIISIFALIGNITCLYILQKSKSKEAHMQASMIFTSNDIIINGGVIFAGVLVSLLDSQIPDLVIGAIVFSIVIRGSFKIMQFAK